MLTRLVAGAAGLSSLVFGCSDAPLSTTVVSPTLGNFVATDADFIGFHGWRAFELSGVEIAASPHIAGTRKVYINRVPPRGSTEFPIGTVIVKEIELGPLVDHRIFARVKRGLPYNSEGAAGWEWFELKNLPDGSVTTLWRGVGPPAGDLYGGDPTGCNTCHGAARANDSVSAIPLELSRF